MHIGLALFLTCAAIVVYSRPVAAFGAGDIPDFAYLNDRAFRHGDIENVLSNIVKNVGGAVAGGGLMGFAASVLSSATGGAKFNKMDVKRVYFGNWLRDYSQAMDIAGLSKMTAQTLVTVVTVLSFMTFGFATAEFEVTADRLGVYLPVEHIDNPKGYAEKEGDAREFHPKLRPPVDPEELEVDPRTGMKKYIATEGQSWDTSSAHVRRTLQKCIEYGRRARGEENNDQWEAFRLLGTALHTLEDLLAHSNWCELALKKLGHEEVFCHVGDEVIIDTPNGQAPPLVTGTFGSADFMHSVLGEGMDHLSEASVTNLTSKMDDAKSQGEGPISTLKSLLSKLPSSGDSSNEEKMEQAEEIKQKAYNFNPDDVAPEEVQRQLWQVLEWRDGVYRDIINKIEMIPGLNEILEEFTNALNAYVFTLLEPTLKPILQQATGVLQDGSKAVIDNDDQFEVFNGPRASDPSHSMLSKDHFGLILNEPAGKIAQVVVEYSVNLIVKAWCDENEDPDRVIDQILETFHHPYFATGDSEIQRLMMDHLERWIGGINSQERQNTLQALTKESVRAGRNKRPGSDNDAQGGQTPGGGYGDVEQSQTRHDNIYRHSENTRDDQDSGGGYGDSRYNPDPPRQTTYARSDGQRHRDEPERYLQGEVNDYSPSDQYGEGRRGNRQDEGGYGRRNTSHEEPSRPSAESEDGGRSEYGQIGEDSHGRERYAKMRNAEDGGYGDFGRGVGGYAPRQEHPSEGRSESYSAGGESHRSSHEERDQSYGGESQSYGGGSQSYSEENQSYSAKGQSYDREQGYIAGHHSYGGESRPYGEESQPYGARNKSYDREQGHVAGHQSYGGERQPYGEESQPHGARNQSYDREQGHVAGHQSYGGERQPYGEESQPYGASSQSYDREQGRVARHQSYDGENQPYGEESQPYGARNQPYGGINKSYEGGELYDGETRSHGGSGRGHGRNEGTSGATEGFARDDRYETARGSYGEGAGYGRQTLSSYGDDRQQHHGDEVDSETFGAEGLSLVDNERRYRDGQPGYGRSLRRNVNDYFQQ